MAVPGGAFSPDKGAGEFLNAFREEAGAELTPRPPQLRGKKGPGAGEQTWGEAQSFGGGKQNRTGAEYEIYREEKKNSKT